MANMQELDSVRQELAGHKARLEEVRDDIKVAKASGNEQRLRELQQENVALLGYMKELQAKKNRLSNELGAAAETDQLGNLSLHLLRDSTNSLTTAIKTIAAWGGKLRMEQGGIWGFVLLMVTSPLHLATAGIFAWSG